MSWSIELLENTIQIPEKSRKKVAKQIGALNLDAHYDEGSVLDDEGYLYFNCDHMEHMDWLWDEQVQDLLKKLKIKGEAKFGSLEGDNAGRFWGYRFDGNGGMRELKGTIQWSEA